jgi:hypothetical protein
LSISIGSSDSGYAACFSLFMCGLRTIDRKKRLKYHLITGFGFLRSPFYVYLDVYYQLWSTHAGLKIIIIFDQFIVFKVGMLMVNLSGKKKKLE